ncbi:uncharacterized protein [Palaemon carinicauda]|uniref:uncharacterized protein n=1 Tax=Palaemon carinicauda TaxID=392227 RepID=UPI0035B674B3
MGDRTLPPQVEGHPQGRLDLIIGRPAVFPPPKASQSFIFSFRWWGDTRLCVLRLPPGKSESRITFYVTCGPKSFRQYLCDAGSLNVSLKIGGGGNDDADDEEKENLSQLTQSPRKVGESPRQTVLRRQLRMKKGWQDGDVLGSFMLPDLKLNARGDYVHECRIVDSAADVIGTVVVTMIFLEGTLEDFQEIKIQREEESTVQQKMEETKLRPRSGIPVRGASNSSSQKSSQDGQRSRSGSFRESLRQKTDRLKSPKRQPGSLDYGGRGKGQEMSQSKKNEGLIGVVHPEVVRRERKHGNRSATRERPASWGLYPLLDGADPESLVESGAVKAKDLPALMHVLEGRSPNVDLANLDPETQKLLEGLDLSMSFSGISTVSSGGSFIRVGSGGGKRHACSVLKGSHGDITDMSGVSTSGIWPLDSKENKEPGKGIKDDHHAQDSSKQGIKKIPPELVTPTKIPLPHSTVRTPSKACRSLVVEKPTLASGKQMPTSCQALENSMVKPEKLFPGKSSSEASDDGSVLVVDVGTLTLSPALLPPKVEDSSKVSGVRVMHRSRVCYLTTLDVSFPHLELPQDWDISQTCASRQLAGNEVHYSAKEILKLPPASAIEILRGQLIIRCFCRRLGERNSEEVGSAGVSLTDIWQLNGSEVRVPLYRSEPIKDDDDSLTRKHGKKGKKREESGVNQPLAHLCFTAKLALAVNQPTMPTGSHKFMHKVVPPKGDSEGETAVASVMHSSLDLSRRKKSSDGISYANMHDSFSSVELDVLSRDKEESFYLCPVPRPVSAGDSAGHPRFNSIYFPTHLSPRSPRPNEWQQSVDYRQVKFVGDVRSVPLETKDANTGLYPCYGSFLTGINGQESSSNKPIESGGESPCIQTVPDFHSDLISHGAVSQSAAMELSEGDFCRVHLEVIKGRNLPWVEGQDRIARPPNCYVRTNLGSLTVQTNVCNEMDNPVWNFAADVLLPYSQLTQTEGNLILKVHHTPWEQHSSPDDPLLGFVCVDATSIWSGHVSLCGWYPLLDLLGCVRGHVKVSLTPHEPPQPYIPPPVQRYPLNLQERPFRQPSPGPQAWKQSYPQQVSLDRDIPTSPRHRVGHSTTPSTCRVPFHPRYANTIPQSSPRILRKNLHERVGKPDFTMNGIGTQSHDSSLFSKYSSVISTESVVVDVPVINEKIAHKRKSPTPDMTPQKLENASKAEKNVVYKSSSSIPVFSPGKDVTRRIIRSTVDSRNLNSVLPQILYQDNFSSNDSQAYRSKGLNTGREPANNSPLPQDNSEKEASSNTFTFNVKHSSDYENTKASTMANDSQLQNKDQGTEKVQEERLDGATHLPSKINTSIDKDITKEPQSKIPSLPASGPSAVNVRPNSCLKVPGSPSLRAKHVTFANRLIQQKGADIKTGTHSLQDRINRSPSSLPRLAHSSTLLPSPNVNSHGQRAEDNASSSHRSKTPSENRYADGSDLQVVPCREGDMQVVTTTVSVPGSKTKYSVSGDSNRGSSASQLSYDKSRSDLIMSFSWMNETQECDTPCVSYIESKHAVHGAVGASENGDLNTVHRKKDKGFSEKSRKLRSRLAANFPLK